jgi:predicted nucleotidyltransferase
MGFAKQLSREEDIRQNKLDWHDHNSTDLETINRVLFTTIAAMEEKNIPYALIGGIAVKELGRPRVTHDIDLFVRPDDALTIVEVLGQKGFTTELRDPHWLYKAWSEEILVDIIFKSSGDIYFDEEVRSHVRRISYNGHFLNAISPEDFIVIKAAVHQENLPHHWHDALAVLTQGNLDWEYLLKRAKHAPRRVLALLLYAQSNDIAVPNDVVQKLYCSLFESARYVAETFVHPYRAHSHLEKPHADKCLESPIYVKARIMEALTTDERIAEHDIKVTVTEKGVIARGEVFTMEQMNAVEEVLHRIAPGMDVKNLVHVRILTSPESSEVIR